MEPHTCSRCGEPAQYVIVGGCLKYLHVQTKYYCRKHWDIVHQNALRAGRTKLNLSCTACLAQDKEYGKIDDYIEAEL